MRWLVVLIVIAACPGPPAERPDRPLPPRSDTALTLTVLSPERGTFVDGAEVAVMGRVPDETLRVTVNGVGAEVGSDGTFRAMLALPPGLTIIETRAADALGTRSARDVRSVLAGPFASTAGTHAPIGVRLGRRGMATLAEAIAGSARAIDFSAAARALNPVYDNGGCLGAQVDIATVTVGKLAVELAPKADALEVALTVDDIEVRLDVHYEIACIAGTTTMTVRTRARARGDLGVALANGRFSTSLPDPIVTLDDFQVDIGSLPRPIAQLVRGVIRGSVEHAVTAALATKLPALADARLAELLANPPRPALLGRDLRIDLVPRRLELSAAGVFVGADAAIAVTGDDGRGRYVAAPTAIAATGGPELRISIAVDAVNQLLAGLWAAGAFERTISRDDVGPLALVLDPRVRALHIALSLPPTVTANDQLELAVGDLIITARDASGREVLRFAVSLRSKLAGKPGELALATTEPTVHAQLLGQALPGTLDAAGVEGIVRGTWTLVASTLDDALAHLPIPGRSGAALQLHVVPSPGAIVFDAARSP